MDVSAALKLGVLQQGKVLAGKKGVNRQIKAAEVMEVPDINEWLTEGILIISTFYSIKDLPKAQIEMFKALIKVNGAGLIIKVGRYVKELPQEMYDLANKHDMPIITLPLDVSFVNVLTVLFEKIYEEKKTNQIEQLQLMNKLVNTEVKSLNDFLVELSSITKENVYFESRDFRLISFSKTEKDKRRKNFSFLSFPQSTISSVEYKKYMSINDYMIENDRMIIPVDEAGERIGYLNIILKNSKALVGILESSRVSIKKQTKLLFLKDRYEIEKRFFQESQWIKDLIRKKKVLDYSSISNWLNLESNHLYGLYALDFFSLEQSIPEIISNEKITHLLYKKIYKVIDRKLPSSLLFRSGKYLYGLYVCNDRQSRPMMIEKIHNVVTQLDRELECDIYCGISLLHEQLTDIDKAKDEAKLALRMREDICINDKIIIYEQMGLNKILLKLKNDKDVLHFFDVTLGELKFNDNENEELIQTLDIFLEENGNHSKTSERIYIHRRTLKYRLNKIESILNINLDDSDTRFLLYLLLKIRKLNSA
ncbi:PucR family transcriptional regulator [Alkalihalobacillus sp. BA299]|uniref:PucR family transcriptional regulator n=1 Tax=Alkalihalobacillus sp. BA299 TaxID=2815938 RepID=UPI001ADCBA59|nr:PucR family transcriptional regulator [Alkalihalobacillus sp. BA299]